MALLLSAGMFLAIALMPGLKYPANPPGVGLVGERSSTFMMTTVISAVGAYVAVAAGLAWSRWCPAPAKFPDLTAMVLDGFPAEVLADFRLYSLMNQALMWLAIGATWAYLASRRLSLGRHPRLPPERRCPNAGSGGSLPIRGRFP